MKSRILFVASTLALALLPLNSDAAIIYEGAKCTKITTTTKVGNSTYQCSLSPNGLVWHQISSSASSATTAQPSPQSSSKTSAMTDAKIAVYSKAKAPSAFGDLLTNATGIPFAAYSDIQKSINTNPSGLGALHSYSGPSSKITSALGESALTKASKIWGNFSQPKVFNAFYSNWADLVKVQSKIDSMIPNSGLRITNQCHSAQSCLGATASVSPDGSGIMFVSIDNPKDPNLLNAAPYWNDFFTTGEAVMHEYTHSVQVNQFVSTPAFPDASQAISTYLPCWFVEGQANFAGVSAGSKSFSQYMHDRTRWTIGAPAGLPDLKSATIANYLTSNTAGSCNNATYQEGYSIGLTVVEALTSIGGTDSTMNLVKAIASGQSWDQAFQSVYATSWNSAVPLLAQVAALSRISK